MVDYGYVALMGYNECSIFRGAWNLQGTAKRVHEKNHGSLLGLLVTFGVNGSGEQILDLQQEVPIQPVRLLGSLNQGFLKTARGLG